MSADPDRELLMKHLIELLEKPEFKETLVKEINESVDIPLIGESTETKIFTTLYGLIVKTVKKYEYIITGVKTTKKD